MYAVLLQGVVCVCQDVLIICYNSNKCDFALYIWTSMLKTNRSKAAGQLLCKEARISCFMWVEKKSFKCI